MVLYVCSLWSDRKDVYDNGKPTDAIRNELDRAEGAKQDIAGTATDASERFDQLINECQSIIDAVRKQSTD